MYSFFRASKLIQTHHMPPALTLQVFTQISLVLLLWGTMCGGLALISDVGYMLVHKLTTDQGLTPPIWVNGRTCMTAVALLVLFPLCLQRHMREVGQPTTLMDHCVATCMHVLFASPVPAPGIWWS
eukprot:GHUV01038458.1.p1 GENE.GHUV01038458.1~~GHUV01038458.1.p1  ORF type:complete len:126 (+),score=14.95 GHUV01038458.1:183-560(+)